MAGDRSYASRKARRRIRRPGIIPVIPSRGDEPRDPGLDRDAYRERDRIERLSDRLKQFRRTAIRHERRAANHLAMLTIDMSMLWL